MNNQKVSGIPEFSKWIPSDDRIILLADNLTTGGARIAEEIIVNWPLQNELYFTHTGNLKLNCSLPQNVFAVELKKTVAYPRHLIRLILSLEKKKTIVLNFTNFPLPRRLLSSNLRNNFREILLVHNSYLIARPRYISKRAAARFTLFQELKKYIFRFCAFLSQPSIVLYQSEWLRKQTNKSVPQLKSPQWIKILPVLTSPSEVKEPPDYKAAFEEKFSFFSDLKDAWFYPSAAYPHKNHDALFSLAEEIKFSRSTCTVWVTLDENDPAGHEFLLSSKAKGFDGIIRNVGWLSHAETNFVLKNCKGLIFLSTFETLGLPLLEAKRLSKPIIAAELETSRELVGGYASFVDLTNSNYAKRMLALMTSSEEWFKPEISISADIGSTTTNEYVLKPILALRTFWDHAQDEKTKNSDYKSALLP